MPARPGFERDWHFDEDAITSGASFSGHERNHFYLNVGGKTFADVSGVSGIDSEADGRSFALLDFDRDGWQDLAVVNANAPLLELFRNRIGETDERMAATHRSLALRFVGSNQTASAQPGRSNRDGIGAVVKLRLGDQTLLRERRGGAGFAAQNSSTLIVGVGARESIDGLTVRWPSGVVQEFDSLPTGTLLTLYEDPSQSSTGAAYASESYVRPEAASGFAARRDLELPRRVFPLHAALQREEAQPQLVIYTTMATWCATCLGELPQWQLLGELFASEDLEVRAVPVDNADTAAKLKRYVERNRPHYRLLETNASQVSSVNQLILDELGKDGLPASFVTDASGQILDSGWGAPSVSLIRRLLSEPDRARPAQSLAAAPQ